VPLLIAVAAMQKNHSFHVDATIMPRYSPIFLIDRADQKRSFDRAFEAHERFNGVGFMYVLTP
jgi:hypothetical protein